MVIMIIQIMIIQIIQIIIIADTYWPYVPNSVLGTVHVLSLSHEATPSGRT